MATLVSGKLVDSKVTQKVYSKLHKGTLSTFTVLLFTKRVRLRHNIRLIRIPMPVLTAHIF